MRCLAASYRRKLNILSTRKPMLSDGAAIPDESVGFCLTKRRCNELEYAEFLKSKEIKTESSGFEPTRTNPKLFEWQNDIVRWALMKGRAAIFADCGLGKTAMQLQ